MFNFDCPATVELTADQVIEVLCYAFEKRYGFKLTPDRFTVKYDQPDYDSTEFDGVKVNLNLLEVMQMQKEDKN